MDESRELNAVIDVIMLAGTILLKAVRDLSVEGHHDPYRSFREIVIATALPQQSFFFSIENTNIS